MSDEVDEEVKQTKHKTFICPYCGEPQEHFIYRSSKRGWAQCLNCGRFTRKKLIPEEFIEEIPDSEEPPESEGISRSEESRFYGDEEGARIPFRRSTPPYALVERILKKYGVKDRSRNIIVDRCRTAGGMHPTELEKALRKLDTGLSKVGEIDYIVEDYYLSLQAEREKVREFSEGGGSYPMRRGEPGYSGGSYPWREEKPPGRRWDYDKSFERKPWDRSQRYPDERGLDERRLLEILERRERDLEDRMRRSTLEDKMGSIGEDISVLATELRNLKENPPGQPTQTGPSEYEKALEHTIDRQDRRQDELMSLIKEERSEAKADMKELRETYGGRVKELQDDLKAAERRANTRSSTEGYKADEMRLVADLGNNIVAAIRERDAPLKILVEGIPLVLGETGAPPQRERGQPASVADLVGPEYVEEPGDYMERGVR